MTTQIILVLALTAVLVFGVREVRGWSRPLMRDLISTKQKRIRVWGLIFLLASVGMVLVGTFLPSPNPHHLPATPVVRRALRWYLFYWSVTALTLLPLIPLAFADARENIKRLAREQAELNKERKELDRLQKTIEMVGSEPPDHL